MRENSFTATTLSWRGIRPTIVQFTLVLMAAWCLPAVIHAAGLPVRVLLPMHWPVLLAGLCYGWRSGGLIGLAAPGVSYLLSGMPSPVIMPSMMVELAAYGAVAGLMRENFRRGYFLSTAVALFSGRLVFLATALVTGAISQTFSSYLIAAMAPGLLTAFAQWLLLPMLAKRIVMHEQSR